MAEHVSSRIVDFTLLDVDEDWPARLYRWWTSPEIRNGKPIAHIEAWRLAGSPINDAFIGTSRGANQTGGRPCVAS